MWSRSDLKEKAKNVFMLNYWPAVVVGLVLNLLIGGGGASNGASSNSGLSKPAQIKETFTSLNSFSVAALATAGIVVLSIVLIGIIVGIAFTVFLSNPLSIGCYRFFMLGSQGERDVKINEIGYVFKDQRYKNVTVVMAMRLFKTILWSLLLIVPGIVKAYEYRMIPYLLTENPQMDAETAFAQSKKMMDGEKWNAFVLDLSFIGWILLSVCTCGILMIFYVTPYIQYTDAHLYLTLRDKMNRGGYIASNTSTSTY